MYTIGAVPVAPMAPRVVTPPPAPRPITMVVKSPLLQRVINQAIAQRAGQTEVRTGVPVTLRSTLLNAAVQKAIAGTTRMRSIAPVAPSVIEQTGLNPPVAVQPTVSPSSPYSLVPDSSGGGGGGAISPAPAPVDQASIFPGDTTDQMAQIEQAGAAGDLSEQEVASIKADLASKPAEVPKLGSWIPVALFVGLIAVAVNQSRRTGGRIGRRGWGD